MPRNAPGTREDKRGKRRDPVTGWALITEGTTTGPKRKTFIYVNNRLEGNALQTIAAVASEEVD